MQSWRNFKDKFRRYGVPEAKEVRALLLTIIVFAFIISFREWGTEKFDIAVGIQNLLVSLVLVAIAFVVHELGHRCVALWMGYRSQYKAWLPGIIASLLIAFISNGHVPLLLPGVLVVTHLAIHRLGKFHYELSMKHVGWIAMSGPIALTLFAITLKPFAESAPVQKLMTICILIAIFEMLPIPPMNGLRTFFGSRLVYVFVYASIIACGLMLSYVSGPLALVGSILAGALMLMMFFVYVDKRW